MAKPPLPTAKVQPGVRVQNLFQSWAVTLEGWFPGSPRESAETVPDHCLPPTRQTGETARFQAGGALQLRLHGVVLSVVFPQLAPALRVASLHAQSRSGLLLRAQLAASHHRPGGLSRSFSSSTWLTLLCRGFWPLLRQVEDLPVRREGPLPPSRCAGVEYFQLCPEL